MVYELQVQEIHSNDHTQFRDTGPRNYAVDSCRITFSSYSPLIYLHRTICTWLSVHVYAEPV